MRCWLFVLLAACTFDPSGVGPADALIDPHDDGGGVPTTWRADTVEDFGAGTLEQAIVEPWGAIGPQAWLTGRLLARGDDSRLFNTSNGSEWAILAAAAPDGLGLSTAAPEDWGFDYPRGVGVSFGDDFTYWLEGEVYLEAGMHSWGLYGDDQAFLELAAPPGAAFARLLTVSYPDKGSANYIAPTTGWYGIHLAQAEGIGGAALDLALDGAPIPPERLRVRADALAGLAEDTFDDAHLLAPIAPQLFGGAGFDYSPDDNDLAALGFTDHDLLSMRWAGQVRIDTAGAYELRLDTDDGQRLWVDGGARLDHWTDNAEDHTTGAIDLDVGWHDLVADLTDDSGGQHIRLIVATGPALAGDPFPATSLRPVAPRRERTASASVARDAAIPDSGQVSAELTPSAPAGSTAIALELAVTIDHPDWHELEIAAIAPDGTAIVALPAASSNRTGAATVRFTVPATGAADGTWQVRVRDTVAGNTGDLSAAALTVRYLGGTPPIAAAAKWTSPVIDLGAVVGFDGLSWAGRLPAAAPLSVRVRTCDTVDACEFADWSAPVTVPGDRPGVLAHRYAQVELTLASDGDVTPSLDWIQLLYRIAG